MKFSETDNFDKVYETAKILMYAIPIESHESIPTFCSHPFTDFIYVPKLENNNIIKTYDLTNSADFKEWSAALLQRLKNERLETIFYIMSKPYRLTFFKYTQSYLTKETFSELFGDIWVTSENPNGDVNVSLRTLISWFKHADKQKLMGEDYETWENFPDKMTLFRGVGVDRKPYGLSWTPNLEKAEWFAHRFDRDDKIGYIQKAIVTKENMLAYFQSRGEEEVVVDTYKIKNDIEKKN